MGFEVPYAELLVFQINEHQLSKYFIAAKRCGVTPDIVLVTEFQMKILYSFKLKSSQKSNWKVIKINQSSWTDWKQCGEIGGITPFPTMFSNNSSVRVMVKGYGEMFYICNLIYCD